MSRFDLPALYACRQTESDPVMRAATVYLGGAKRMTTLQFETHFEFFTESLILAQDERWRRA